MVQPTDISIEDLVKEFNSSSSLEPSQQLQEQRRLVVQVLKGLKRKCRLICDPPCSSDSTDEDNLPRLFEQIELKRLLRKQLETGLLPCLRNRITALSLSLDPTDLRKDLKEKLKVVIGILLELNQTMDQMKTSIATIAPRLVARDVTNDQELKELKAFRSSRLRNQLADLFIVSSELFHRCARLLESFESSVNQVELRRDRVLKHTSIFWHTIDRTIEWFGRSELNLLQDRWQLQAKKVDVALADITVLINMLKSQNEEEEKATQDRSEPSSGDDVADNDAGDNGEEEEDGEDNNEEDNDAEDGNDEDDVDSEYDMEVSSSTAEVIELARMAVPIVKLSRILLKKLSKSRINTNNLLESNKGMSSSQIEELLSSTSISWVIEEMLFTLESAADYEAGRSLTYKMMLEFYRDLTITCLEMSHILADHIIPFVVSTSQQSASFWFYFYLKSFCL
ncbi:hypothetical protein PCANC_09906 [Puccinia coronata f. sp. avenae]|uniref:Uncharacterized protein n=1 Tax=Puccinia coronata f. sp. avenae TaxID=200324 RepID=A0A2N5SEL3_9BASI|nr:hypothetical protein PCANC_21646 [Puccinia coronata f. sp. avenae]PLW42416.1 hypothetical protein PCANC_09906 [Puccinia coronata f. sp. avenae]